MKFSFRSPADKEILQLAGPNIISNISIPLLGSIDLAIVGHLNSTAYIGAIAVGTMIFNFIYWSFGFLRMGISGVSAQAYGENHQEKQQKILLQGLLISQILAVFLLIMQIPIEKIAFSLIDGSAEVEKFAADYFYIRIWAAPATLALYVFYGWFLGMQNAKIPMIIAISGNIINTVANFIFVYTFHLNSSGVALGTVVAQYTSLILAILLAKKHFPEQLKLNIKIKHIITRLELKQFTKLNSDIFFRTLCLIAVFTFFTSSSAAKNDTALAVNTLLLQFFMFFSYFEDGFAYAAEALIGKSMGEKNQKLIIEYVRKIFKWGFIVSLLFSLLYLQFSKQLLYLLTDSKSLKEAADEYKYYIFLIPIVSFATFIWDGIYIGATASKEMRNSMIIATFLVFFPAYFLFKDIFHMQNHSIWLALLLFLFARGFSQTIIALKNYRTTIYKF
jgi:MATE family multidrug resistance protein